MRYAPTLEPQPDCLYRQVDVGDWVVELNEPIYPSDPSAEVAACHRLRAVIGEGDWEDWVTRGAIAVPWAMGGLTFHVTQQFAIVEARGVPMEVRCLHPKTYPTALPPSDMTLALWLICRNEPTLVQTMGVEQLERFILARRTPKEVMRRVPVSVNSVGGF